MALTVGRFALGALIASSLAIECNRGNRHPSGDAAVTDSVLRTADVHVARAPVGPPRGVRAADPPPRWCVESLPHADARALDRHGHMIALFGTRLADETAGTSLTLPPADPCAARRSHLAFDANGNAVIFAGGRLYVRSRDAASYSVTPACTDVGGEPWTLRAGGGWAVLGRRRAAGELALLMTNETVGAFGWYAVIAMDASLSSALLEGDGGSMVALEAGGHAIMVDRENHVAGELLAASNALWSSVTRNAIGVAIARDASETTREVVYGTTVQNHYELERSIRPAGPRTLGVYLLDFGRRLALTDRGIEWAASPGSPYIDLARWPADVSAPEISNASFGWLPNGSPAVLVGNAIASARCPP